MSTHFWITVKWISDRFHGFVEGTELIEWPPSPFRLFQSLLASAHRHGMTESRREALAWLERQVPPELFAVANPAIGAIFNHWVPDNDNLVTHRKGSIRAFKPVLHGDQPLVHYVWAINSADQPPIEALDDLTATIGWLGWAVDSAYATATLASKELADTIDVLPNPLSLFQPTAKTTRSFDSLRVAKLGSTSELESLYIINDNSFSDQTQRRRRRWAKIFDRFIYTTSDRKNSRPHALFIIRDENEDPFWYPHAKLIHLAGMLRHKAIQVMKNFRDPAWLESFVAGHRPKGLEDHKQFSYIPLPTIGHPQADALIRRVMILAPFNEEAALNHLANQLDGIQLKSEDGRSRPLLERLQSDNVTKQFLNASQEWATVTPVILPGHDDHKPAKTIKLIEKSLLQSGIDQPCTFTWSALPNFRNTLTAHKYDRNKRPIGYFRPDHLQHQTAVHLHLTFQTPVSGPLSIGAGRHCGLGILAALPK